MKKLLYGLLIFAACLFKSYAAGNNDSILSNTNGISRMINIPALPILDHNVRVNYEGSIDKKGANADWDWWLYEDERGEWVIFDVDGPGCIYNMVQHRYLSSREPIFRFYFDGEDTPRFTLKLSEFGEKYPFIEPLSSSYIGPVDNGRGPIRVVRSFVPMQFEKGCRITSDIKLEGHDRAKGHGGWGQVVYHSYTTSEGVTTFTGEENYDQLIQQWKGVGTHPYNTSSETNHITKPLSLSSGGIVPLFEDKKPGNITSLRLYIENMKPERLHDVWIHATWDNHQRVDVSCPIGCFFGNSLGYNSTDYLLMGATTDGWFYNFFPMPYWEGAVITLENRGKEDINIGFAEVITTGNDYNKADCGYFRSSDYYARKHTEGADSQIATLKGTGKLVAAHVTCYGERPNIITCEGDVRVYIDGNRTPQVESDGSESYICYGWGFPTPAETHPSGGYDGLSDNPWSMTRLLIGDSYPFHSELHFQIESGENNNQYLEHLGAVFYYGKEEVSLIKTDSLDLNVPRSVKSHKYKVAGNKTEEYLESYFEGDEDHQLIGGRVVRFDNSSSFTMKILPDNNGVKLRRRSDQNIGRQCARVFIDDVEVTERRWYVADKNPYKRWLEDEFEIPAQYTKGKSKLNIRIVPVAPCEGVESSWNESSYDIFIYKL